MTRSKLLETMLIERSMSYCKFENTYQDLQQCYHDWNEANNDEEVLYRRLVFKLCQSIVKECSLDGDEWNEERDVVTPENAEGGVEPDIDR